MVKGTVETMEQCTRADKVTARKPRRQPLPDHKRFNLIRNIKSTFRRMFVDCVKHTWTMTAMLAKRNALLFGDSVTVAPGEYTRLAQLDQAELMGYWEALHDALMDTLEFRYLIDGKWYTPQELFPSDKTGNLHERATNDNSHYVHVATENGPEYRIYT